MLRRVIFLVVLPFLLYSYEARYSVKFLGLENKKALKAVENVSALVKLKDRPPASINALRFRIESDIPQIIKMLHAYAYYDARITWEIEESKDKLTVFLFIHSGAQYKLSNFSIYSADCTKPFRVATCPTISPETLGVQLQAPAISVDIINAEKNVIEKLRTCGYPLAKIEKREIIADNLSKTIQVELCVNSGPLCKFGPISMYGLNDVERRFVTRKILWKEGDIYNYDLVKETQKYLIETDLFASVLITHSQELDEEGLLPIKIRFSESKHKTVAVGASFATTDGFGGSLSWANRNFRSMGELISLDAWVARVNSQGILTYNKPDFIFLNLHYIWQAMVIREHVTVYLAKTFSLTNRIERKIDKRKYFSIGLKGEYISEKRSLRNGQYYLLGLPFFFRYTHVNNILNPLQGYNWSYKSTLYQSLEHDKSTYYKQTLWASGYMPLLPNKKIVFALRGQFGSIAGAAQKDVPLSKLFFGGSEDDLRGYKFKTVSPLNQIGNPVGGRGSIYWTAELRFSLTNKIGLVGFSDWGNVTTKQYPTIFGKWFKSVGVGLRYFTFFGPLRMDVGFPLNRRPFDPRYRIYVSIGQSF